MKLTSKRLRGGALAAAMLIGGGGALALVATPAGASSTTLTAVGSQTTTAMVQAIFNPTGGSLALNNVPWGTTAGTHNVAPTATTCAAGVAYNAGTPGPKGSGAGKSALKAEESAAATAKGCIDIARSSSGPGTANSTANFRYYAYALDGVAPLLPTDAPRSTAAHTVGSGQPAAADGLTLTQIKDIYNCTITNWATVTVNGVSGTSATIVRYFPQPSSGTGSFYDTILGFNPTIAATVPLCASGAITIAENEIATIPSGSRTAAIFVYSAGQYAAQKNTSGSALNTTSYALANVENTIGTGSAQSFIWKNSSVYSINTTTVTEANEFTFGSTVGRVPGVRYLYNIIDSALPSYQRAKEAVGFSNVAPSTVGGVNYLGGTASLLCAGRFSSTITAQNFVSLGNGAGPGGTVSNLAGSFCRLVS